MVVWSMGGQVVVPGIKYKIGREPDSYIPISVNAEKVSRCHATFWISETGEFVLLDSSKSGTYVNGNQVKNEETIIQSGDIVTVADFPMDFPVLCHEVVVCTSRISEMRELKKQCKRIGATVSNSIEESTHLIIEDLTRTEKLYNALMLGLPIVTPKWLRDLLKDKFTKTTKSRRAFSETSAYWPKPPKTAGKMDLVNPDPTTRKEFFAGKSVVFLLSSAKEKETLNAARVLEKMLLRVNVASSVAYVANPDDYWSQLRDFIVIEYLSGEEKDFMLNKLRALGFPSPSFSNQAEFLDIISSAEVHRLRVLIEPKRVPPSSQQLLVNSQKSQSQRTSQASQPYSQGLDLTGIGLPEGENDDDGGWGELKTVPVATTTTSRNAFSSSSSSTTTSSRSAKMDTSSSSSSTSRSSAKTSRKRKADAKASTSLFASSSTDPDAHAFESVEAAFPRSTNKKAKRGQRLSPISKPKPARVSAPIVSKVGRKSFDPSMDMDEWIDIKEVISKAKINAQERLQRDKEEEAKKAGSKKRKKKTGKDEEEEEEAEEEKVEIVCDVDHHDLEFHDCCDHGHRTQKRDKKALGEAPENVYEFVDLIAVERKTPEEGQAGKEKTKKRGKKTTSSSSSSKASDSLGKVNFKRFKPNKNAIKAAESHMERLVEFDVMNPEGVAQKDEWLEDFAEEERQAKIMAEMEGLDKIPVTRKPRKT